VPLAQHAGDREVRHLGHQDRQHGGQRLHRVERLGELTRDACEQLQALLSTFAVGQRTAAGGDVGEVGGDPAALRDGPHLVPGVQRLGVVGVEDDRLAGPGDPAVAVLEGGADRRGEEVPHHAADQLPPRTAQDALGLGVHVGEAPVGAEPEVPDRHPLEDHPHALLARAQRGGVRRDPDELLGAAGLPRHRAPTRHQPCDGAVRALDAELRLVDAAGVDGGPQGGRHVRQVVRVDPGVEGVDGAVEGLLVVPEGLEQRRVPVERARGQVPLEGPDARGLHRGQQQALPGGVAVLLVQRRDLQLRRCRRGQVLERGDVLRGPLPRTGLVGADRPHDLTVVADQRDGQVGPDRTTDGPRDVRDPRVGRDVGHHQPFARGGHPGAQGVLEPRARARRPGEGPDGGHDDAHVREQGHLGRRRAEHLRGQRCDVLQRGAALTGLQQPGGGRRACGVVPQRGGCCRVHPDVVRPGVRTAHLIPSTVSAALPRPAPGLPAAPRQIVPCRHGIGDRPAPGPFGTCTCEVGHVARHRPAGVVRTIHRHRPRGLGSRRTDPPRGRGVR
jgi:hypothetical protein